MTIVHIALERMVQSFATAKNVGHAICATKHPTKVGRAVSATKYQVKVGHGIGATNHQIKVGQEIGATKRPIKVGQEIDATITISFLHGLGNSIRIPE